MKMVAALGYYIVFVLLLVTITLWELHERWEKKKSASKSKMVLKRRYFWQKYSHKHTYK